MVGLIQKGSEAMTRECKDNGIELKIRKTKTKNKETMKSTSLSPLEMASIYCIFRIYRQRTQVMSVPIISSDAVDLNLSQNDINNEVPFFESEKF